MLRQFMAQLTKKLQAEIPKRQVGQDFKTESAHIEKTYKAEDGPAYAELGAFAEARNFSLLREGGRLLYTLIDKKSHSLTENEALALPKERQAEIDQAEQELRAEIARFPDKTRSMERIINEGLAALRRQVLADEFVWETLRSFLRSGCLQIEESGMMYLPIAAVSLAPEPVVSMSRSS